MMDEKQNKPIKHLISFSGGKDSTALVLWAKENLPEFDVIFADTKWEHPITYEYVDYIDKTLLDGKLIRVTSKKYDGFEDLSIKRKRVPSTKARFCTQELKLFPIHEYVHSELSKFEITMYVGIRAEESPSRAKMKESNFDLDYFGCWIKRPLLNYTVKDVFNLLNKHNVEPNPLYKMGFKRVGCMPCIMSTLPELKVISEKFPEVVDKVKALENKVGRTFFAPDKIPKKLLHATDPKTGKKIAWASDVFRYVSDNPNQLKLFKEEPESCMSHYNICE